MTRAQALLTAAIATAALAIAGCAGDRDPSSGPASTAVAASGTTTASPAAITAGAAAEQASRPSTPGVSEAPGSDSTRKAEPTNPPVDDRTGDLVPGRRTVTGTVERTGEWILLRTDNATWALLGRRAETLRAGSTATVTGTTAQCPAGCPADHALSVYSAR
ncbi:hypothetical protein ONA91_39240 [Micromonospora sp. DR5-3]|uniref:hypothetical protein n=1 Tax=unclassified Micromonospora TaxID=2617518 RepID=UPI0011D7B8A9|nr:MULTISPECIES: hypothetical protein [unclassified Micromonospora]MCW3820484.1 hypothetical protein [Micromonospora sp. DR5-3]TYC20895.1 hypothetical protein FXF52_28715 [Micromonospora sp. MP36]